MDGEDLPFRQEVLMTTNRELHFETPPASIGKVVFLLMGDNEVEWIISYRNERCSGFQCAVRRAVKECVGISDNSGTVISSIKVSEEVREALQAEIIT